MSTKQWDCLYKILMTYQWQKAFLHKKIHPFRVQYLSFSHNLTVRREKKKKKKNNPESWLTFRHILVRFPVKEFEW